MLGSGFAKQSATSIEGDDEDLPPTALSLQAGYACPAPTKEVSDATKLQQRRRVLSGPLTTAFDEPMSKRRRGYPSETRVKRGDRGVQTPAGFKDFEEKLGRNDLCPCGSGKCFQEVLPAIRQALTAHTGTSIAANDNNLKHKARPGAGLCLSRPTGSVNSLSKC